MEDKNEQLRYLSHKYTIIIPTFYLSTKKFVSFSFFSFWCSTNNLRVKNQKKILRNWNLTPFSEWDLTMLIQWNILTCSLTGGDSLAQSLSHFIANGNEGITALPLKLLSERPECESSYKWGKTRSLSSLRSLSNIASGSAQADEMTTMFDHNSNRTKP